MKKNRMILCLLICGLLLYYAVPNLSIEAGGAAGIFAISWLGFALLAIGGNLVSLLYSPKKQKRGVGQARTIAPKKRLRQFE
jgi:hypothetical protein